MLSWKSLGHLYDAFILISGILDPLSDALCTYDFFVNGEMKFFWASILIFFLGSISDSIGFCITVVESNWMDLREPIEWIGATILFAFLGPLLPLIQWFVTHFNFIKTPDMSHNDAEWDKLFVEAATNITASANKKKDDDDSSLITSAASGGGNRKKDPDYEGEEEQRRDDEQEDSAATRALREQATDHQLRELIALDKEVRSRMFSYFVSGIQAVSESLPMCVVHLLAAGYRGEPSMLQAVSLLLSLFSVISKGILLSRSFSAKAVTAKVCFFAFDIFSTSFIIVSLTNSKANVVAEKNFFGYEVNSVTYWWLTLKFWNFALLSIIAVGCLCVVLYENTRTQEKIGVALIFMVGYSLLTIPFLLLQELAKFSLIFSLPAFAAEPMMSEFPVFAFLHEFLNSKDSEDGGEKRDLVDWKTSSKQLFKHCQNSLVDVLNDAKQAQQSHMNFAAGTGHAYVSQSIGEKIGSLSLLLSRFRRLSTSSSSSSSSSSSMTVRQDGFYTRARHILLCRHFLDLRAMAVSSSYSILNYINRVAGNYGKAQLLKQKSAFQAQYQGQLKQWQQNLDYCESDDSDDEREELDENEENKRETYRPYEETSRREKKNENKKKSESEDDQDDEKEPEKTESSNNDDNNEKKKKKKKKTGTIAKILKLQLKNSSANTRFVPRTKTLLSPDFSYGAREFLHDITPPRWQNPNWVGWLSDDVKKSTNKKKKMANPPPPNTTNPKPAPSITLQDVWNFIKSIELIVVLGFTAAITALILFVLTTLTSFSFPIFYWYYYSDKFSPLCSLLFAPTLVTGILSLLHIMPFLRYMRTCFFFQGQVRFSTIDHSAAKAIVDSFYSLPTTLVRHFAVPSEAIPSDCFDEHVLPFLDARSVKLFGASSKDFAAMMRELEKKKKEE